MTALGGALRDPTKVMGARIGAYAVDAILITIVFLAILFVVDSGKPRTASFGSTDVATRYCDQLRGPVTAQPSGSGEGSDTICWVSGGNARFLTPEDLRTIQFHGWILGSIVSLLDLVVLQVLVGGSVGKLLFGLRVVTIDGRRAGWWRNLVRWLLLIVDAACCWIPGLLSSFNTKGHKRIGDMAAGTFVVHRSAEGRLLGIPGIVPDHVIAQLQLAQAAAQNAATAPPAAGQANFDQPVFDQSRNTYVRYDQTSGTWFEWDEANQRWIPART